MKFIFAAILLAAIVVGSLEGTNPTDLCIIAGVFLILVGEKSAGKSFALVVEKWGNDRPKRR